MSEGPIILEGVTLMALGMGFVFCFLTLLVGAIRLLAATAGRFVPAPVAPKATPIPSEPASDDSMVAAISAALHHHKKKFS